MLTVFHILNFVGMILLPLALGLYLTRALGLSWKLLLAGALTFLAAQVLHVPLVFGLSSAIQRMPLPLYAVLLGLLAGAFEESARYILFKRVLRTARSWNEAVLVGLGHGGVEAVLLGMMAAVGFATMIGYRGVDLATVPGIPADQLELARQQVAAYWSAPWYMALVGLVERVFALVLHVGLSVMVLYAIVSGRPLWFWLAVLWHALVDAVAVYVLQTAGVLAVEGVVGLFALISVWIVLHLKRKFISDADDGGPGTTLVHE